MSHRNLWHRPKQNHSFVASRQRWLAGRKPLLVVSVQRTEAGGLVGERKERRHQRYTKMIVVRVDLLRKHR